MPYLVPLSDLDSGSAQNGVTDPLLYRLSAHGLRLPVLHQQRSNLNPFRSSDNRFMEPVRSSVGPMRRHFDGIATKIYHPYPTPPFPSSPQTPPLVPLPPLPEQKHPKRETDRSDYRATSKRSLGNRSRHHEDGWRYDPNSLRRRARDAVRSSPLGDTNEDASDTASSRSSQVLITSDPTAEVLERMEIVFEAYLTFLCNNVGATTSAGEVIHQSLLPSKYRRQELAGDFRPFRFRTQAFTTGYAEWIYEDQRRYGLQMSITLRQMREFIWRHPLVSRYNPDGKKSKSKGNHVWTVEVRREPDGSRTFRRFERRIVGSQVDASRVGDSRAHVGYLWQWTPRLWDPHRSLHDTRVEFSSPEGSLPPWLSWNNNILSGTPTDESEESISIQTQARLLEKDGTVSEYQQSFNLAVKSYQPGLSL